MKSRFMYSVFALLILVSLILPGCAPAPTSAPAATEAPAAAVEPAATTAPVPTEIPAPEVSEPVVLTIMHNYAPDDAHAPILNQAIDDFMKANPDIKIETQIYSDIDIPLKVETAFLAGQEPDIVFSNYALTINTWIDQGVTVPVDDLITSWGYDGKFTTDALKASTDKQKRLVAFPFEGFTWPVWFNNDIMEKAGVSIPKNTDELVEAAVKIRAAGYEPFAVGGMDWSGYAVFTTIVQLKLTDDEMREVFGKGGFAQNQKAMDGIRLFCQLRDAGVFADHSEGMQADAMNALFFSGKAAMMQGGSWSFGSLPAELQGHVTLSGFPVSIGSPHGKPVIYGGFGKGVWVTRNGNNKLDAVRKFIDFLYQPSVIAQFVSQTGMASPLADVDVSGSDLSPIMQESISYVKDVLLIAITDDYVDPKTFDALYKASAGAFIPGATPESIAAELDKIYTNQ